MNLTTIALLMATLSVSQLSYARGAQVPTLTLQEQPGSGERLVLWNEKGQEVDLLDPQKTANKQTPS